MGQRQPPAPARGVRGQQPRAAPPARLDAKLEQVAVRESSRRLPAPDPVDVFVVERHRAGATRGVERRRPFERGRRCASRGPDGPKPPRQARVARASLEIAVPASQHVGERVELAEPARERIRIAGERHRAQVGRGLVALSPPGERCERDHHHAGPDSRPRKTRRPLPEHGRPQRAEDDQASAHSVPQTPWSMDAKIGQALATIREQPAARR